MSNKLNYRELILNQPSYWVESINGALYDAIIKYKNDNKLKNKDLAELFEISNSRVSQILNTGNINFSIDKLVSIVLKTDLFPVIDFIDKKEYLNKERLEHEERKKELESCAIIIPYKEKLFSPLNTSSNKTKFKNSSSNLISNYN